MELRLVQTRFGRVLLRVLCCLRKPKHLSWRWSGIVRSSLRSDELLVISSSEISQTTLPANESHRFLTCTWGFSRGWIWEPEYWWGFQWV